MKTAVAIPDELFHQIDFCSRRLKVSRSRLLADAAREYLARQRAPFDATAAWNEVIAEAASRVMTPPRSPCGGAASSPSGRPGRSAGDPANASRFNTIGVCVP